MPEGAELERLTDVIWGLSARLDTPSFAPHVTLLAGMAGEETALVTKAEAVAAQLPGLRVRLGRVEGRDEYFRCLYVRAEPVKSLHTAHLRSSEAFDRPPDPDFLPHLSLVYGRLTPNEKRGIAASVKPDLPDAFEATALHVWRTEGTVDEWASRGRFDLRGPHTSVSTIRS